MSGIRSKVLMSEPPTLTSDRLVLRPFEPTDAPAVQAIAGAREIADTTLSIPHPYPDGAAAAWIGTHRAAWQAGTAVTYAITRRDAGALVGAIGLSIDAAHASAEMGYWVAVPHWNQGYCTEAVRRLMDFAFGPLRLHRIQARHLTRNPGSGRVMQKLGMRLEGVSRDAVLKWGQFEDLALYAILASEWKEPHTG
jgi:RimJ/RimL family protein N-acetyltransferase